MQNAHKFPQCQIYAPSSSFPPIYKAVVVWISRLYPFCACLAPANEKHRSKLLKSYCRISFKDCRSDCACSQNQPTNERRWYFFQASQPVSGDRRGLPGENSWRSAVWRAVRGDGQWTRPQDRAPHPAGWSVPAPGRGDPGRQHCRTHSR